MIRYATAVSLVVAFLCGCRRDRTETRRIVDAKNLLLAVAKLIMVAESLSEKGPPQSLPELVEWIASNASGEESYIDYHNKSIRDPWDSEIVLVSQDETLVAIGSPGPNGRWQNGESDDIVLKLEDVRSGGGCIPFQ